MKIQTASASLLVLLLAGATLAFGNLPGRDLGARDSSQAALISTNVAEALSPEEIAGTPDVDLLEPRPIDQITELSAEQAAAVAAPSGEKIRRAVGVVARVLQLRPDQIEDLVGLMQLRREAATPVQQQIRAREELLRQLVQAGDNPTAIGRQVLELRELRHQLARIQTRFLHAFEDLLDPDQLDRWRAVRVAARLSPVLPAFGALALL